MTVERMWKCACRSQKCFVSGKAQDRLWCSHHEMMHFLTGCMSNIVVRLCLCLLVSTSVSFYGSWHDLQHRPSWSAVALLSRATKRGSPSRHGYCSSVLLLAGSGDLNHTLTIAGIVWRDREKRPHTGFIVLPVHTNGPRRFYGTESFPSRDRALFGVVQRSTERRMDQFLTATDPLNHAPPPHLPIVLPNECDPDVSSKCLKLTKSANKTCACFFFSPSPKKKSANFCWLRMEQKARSQTTG